MFLSARRALEFSHNQDPKWTSNVIRSPHGRATGTPRASISLSSSRFRLRGHVNCAEWAEACLRGCPPCQRMRRTGRRPESPTARPVPCHRHQSLAHRGLNVIDRDDEGRILRRPVGLFREEAAIDRARLLRPALVRFGRRGNDIVAHLLPKHLCLPAKYVLVELRHALAVVVGHFEVNDRVHFAHDGPPCRLFETFEATRPRAPSEADQSSRTRASARPRGANRAFSIREFALCDWLPMQELPKSGRTRSREAPLGEKARLLRRCAPRNVNQFAPPVPLARE